MKLINNNYYKLNNIYKHYNNKIDYIFNILLCNNKINIITFFFNLIIFKMFNIVNIVVHHQ